MEMNPVETTGAKGRYSFDTLNKLHVSKANDDTPEHLQHLTGLHLHLLDCTFTIRIDLGVKINQVALLVSLLEIGRHEHKQGTLGADWHASSKASLKPFYCLLRQLWKVDGADRVVA